MLLQYDHLRIRHPCLQICIFARELILISKRLTLLLILFLEYWSFSYAFGDLTFFFLLYCFYHFSLLLALQCQMSPDIMHWRGAGPKRPGSNICPVQEQIDLWIHYWWPWKIPRDQHKFAAQKWNSPIHIWHRKPGRVSWSLDVTLKSCFCWVPRLSIYDLSRFSCCVLTLTWN